VREGDNREALDRESAGHAGRQTVSHRHAEFHCKRGEFRIVDVGSLNGTYVNGESIHSVVLTNGDDIRMGKFRLMFLAWP
jgi:pSer/pThr/pTyr-binding forkhead associated (FHA) protein